MSETRELAKVDDSLLIKYLDAAGIAKTLQDNERLQFVEIAKAYQLNPFKREIYCVAYGKDDNRSLSIITGYETYLKRAERTGKLKGWKCWTEGSCKIETKTVEKTGRNGPYTKRYLFPTGDLVAKIQILKDGWSEPFEHEVYLDEYAQANEMWGQKPRTMLKKVCIGQGFRLAFPDDLGGLPYLEEEMEAMRDVTPRDEPQDDSQGIALESKIVQMGLDQSKPVQEPKPEKKLAKPADKPEATDPEQKPWQAEWNERAMALSKKVASWPKPDRDALELGSLVKEAKQSPELMELAEQRAQYYLDYKDKPEIDIAMETIKAAGRSLAVLHETMGELKNNLAKKEPAADPNADDQLF